MNEGKRKTLRDAIRHLDQAFSLVDDVCEKEEDALDNCPENLQGSERYFSMESAVDHLQSALDDLNTAKEQIESAMQ